MMWKKWLIDILAHVFVCVMYAGFVLSIVYIIKKIYYVPIGG